MDKVLFIGNSYTFFNDMPKLFEALAIENGYKCEVTSLTKGGRKLVENIDLDDDFAYSVKYCAKNNKYSVLFLQDQSLIAIDSPEDFHRGISKHVELFSPDRVILYATWGRKAGSDKLAERNLSSAEMTERIANEYAMAAKNNSADVSNVGLAFKKISENYPEIELYTPDLSHPSYEGSCLAALAHYKTFYGEAPNKTDSLKLEGGILSIFKSVI